MTDMSYHGIDNALMSKQNCTIHQGTLGAALLSTHQSFADRYPNINKIHTKTPSSAYRVNQCFEIQFFGFCDKPHKKRHDSIKSL